MEKDKNKNKEGRVFRPSLWKRSKMLFGAAIVAIVAIAAAQANDTNIFIALIVIAVCGGLVWLLYMQATQSSLLVNKKGIEYRFASARIETQWNNLRGIVIERTGKTSTIELTFRNPVRQKVSGGKLDKMLLGQEQVSSITLSDIASIPTKRINKPFLTEKVDFDKFKETELGSALYEHAPHLFDNKTDDIDPELVEDLSHLVK